MFMSLPVTPWIAVAAETPSFDHTLETASTVVHFHAEDEAFARRIGEALDYARISVAKYYGHVDGKVQAYVYRSNAEMAGGLERMLDYQPWQIRAVLHVGISACTQGTLHVHRRRQDWDERTLWRVVVDEHVQGVTEARFGFKPAFSATWIEEGVSSYIAYHALKDKFPEFANQYLAWRQRAAFKSLLAGKFPHFKDISTRESWHENIVKGWVSWNSQYAAGFMGVLYMANRYGFDVVEQVLASVSRGTPYATTMEDVFGFKLDEFETRVRLSVFLKGVFDLYLHYTVLLMIIVGVAVLMLFRHRHSRRRNLAPIQ